jgi:hypothetical protein
MKNEHDKDIFAKSEINFDLLRNLLKQGREIDRIIVKRIFPDRLATFVPTNDDILTAINSLITENVEKLGRSFVRENYPGVVLKTPDAQHGWCERKWEQYGGRPFFLCSNYWLIVLSIAFVLFVKLDVLVKTELLFSVSTAYIVGRSIYKYGRGKKETGFLTSEFHLSVFLLLWVFANYLWGSLGELHSAIFFCVATGVYTLARDTTKHRSKQNTLLVR